MDPSFVLDYVIARRATPLLLSFELCAALAVTALALLLARRTGDPRPLRMLLLGAAAHTVLEALAEIGGVRTFDAPQVLGLAVGFPITSLITGAFEGGAVTFFAWHAVAWRCDGDRRAGAVFLLGCAAFAAVGLVGAARMHAAVLADPDALAIVRRAMFHARSLRLLAVFGALTAAWLAFSPRVGPGDGRRLLAYWMGVIGFTFALAMPLHGFGLRTVEVATPEGFHRAGAWAEIALLYVWNLPVEGGWYLPYFALAHRAGLLWPAGRVATASHPAPALGGAP